MAFKGACTALITPFSQGKIDFEKMKKIVDSQIEAGIDALLVLGTTGEGSTLTEEEKYQVMDFAKEHIVGRTQLIVGTGSNDTQKSISLSKYAEKIGADALLVITPYYNKTTQNGLIAHFGAIAKEVSTEIILYNVPGRTGMNISPKTLLELSKIPNIVGVKEASGDIGQVAKMLSLVPESFSLYSGNDDSIVPVMSLGGAGVISVLSNILPKEVVKMSHSFLEGDWKTAQTLQLRYQTLIDGLFCETNPIPVKKAMALMGQCEDEIRLPLVEMQGESLHSFKRTLQEYGLIGEEK